MLPDAYGLLIPGFLVACAGCAHARMRARAVDNAESNAPTTKPVRAACCGVRAALIVGALCTGLCTLACAEGLSWLGTLRAGPVRRWWLIATIVAMAAWGIATWKARGAPRSSADSPREPDAAWGIDRALLVIISLIVSIAGLCAWFAPPNNWDSLTYHLPRQVRWIQQGSLEHFGTHNSRQLQMPPMAEFVGVELMLLTGNDHYANLVQWSAYVLTLIGVSLIARELGLPRRGQILAAFFFAAIPMAYLQASNTKNDVVLSLWTCTAGWLAVRTWDPSARGLALWTGFGLSVGFMLLTKGTAWVIAPPIIALGALGLLRQLRLQSVASAVLAGGLALLVNAPHWQRNWVEFGSPLGIVSRESYRNDVFAWNALLSNVVRNATLHLATPHEQFNRETYTTAVQQLCHWLGSPADDPRTTYQSLAYQVQWTPLYEDTAGAPAHVLLTLLLLILFPFLLRRTPRPLTAVYLTVPLLAAVLFCALLKWQPWHARLHLPILCLASVSLSWLIVARLWNPLGPIAVGACLLALAPTVFFNHVRRPLGPDNVFSTPRIVQMHAIRPYLADPIQAAATEVRARRPGTLAFWVGGDEWEYPIERILLDTMERPPVFTSFEFLNSERWRGREPAPNLLIGMNCPYEEMRHTATGTLYRRDAQFGIYGLYSPVRE